jgi:hypothetical protein
MKKIALFLLMITLNACAKAPLPVAQFQLIDADTMKPIEGGWVNFIWYGGKLTGNVKSRPCVRAVLGRSDQNGWVRDTARESFWKLDSLGHIFVPGYEYFNYRYGEPDEQHVTAYVRMDKIEAGRFPAWEENLRKLGYTWKPHEWTKVYPADGFRDTRYAPDDGRVYFVRYRSMPTQVEQNFPMVGTVCDKPGAENIGMGDERGREIDRLRASESLKYLCRADWLSLQPDRPIPWSSWIQRSLWLLPDQNDAQKQMHTRFPDFTKQPYWSDPMASQRPFSRDEQSQFCEWLMPLIKQESNHAKN